MAEDYKDLVNMLDELMKNGSAHINVKNGENTEVKNVGTFACEGGACSVPTLHKGIDD
ncbi:MAG: hypothetical protein Q4B31_00905 [Clostridia bacterium]|nr:hypothetical protein [Clostridia bacterium]